MAEHDANNTGLRGVVAVGASAGGVEALTRLVAGLPADLPFAVLVALHLPKDAPSVLARILDRRGPLTAVPAREGAPLEPGLIHVAVPDRHLLVDDGRVVLSRGPTENTHRPAINALFRSVAADFGPRAIGVLMSGVLDDGVLGSGAIQSCGGTTIVQQPDDALYPTMPMNAIRAGVVDHQVAARDVGALLQKLAEREIEDREMEIDELLALENRIAMGERVTTPVDTDELGPHSGYICPDCNGSLMQVGKDNFRCRVGHAWTAEALLSARDSEIEGALWVALRSLQEKAKLAQRMADNIGNGPLYDRYVRVAHEAKNALRLLGEQLSTKTAATETHDA